MNREHQHSSLESQSLVSPTECCHDLSTFTVVEKYVNPIFMSYLSSNEQSYAE